MMQNLQSAEQILLKSTDIAQKMRALFFLRNIPTLESAKILTKVFSDNSVLLKHETAYVLGQMRIEETKDYLISILDDPNQDVIVRHEAAEALGNFADRSLIPHLQKYTDHHELPLRETCLIAIEKLKDNGVGLSPFDSFDPAYPEADLTEAKRNYLNDDADLYLKYRAMFALRNENTDESVATLIKGFSSSSSLLKHEIAFVLGQMRNPAAIQALEKVISDESEHPMVRHEAAEALGSIGTDECECILRRFVDHPCEILSESAVVGLKIIECERKGIDYCALE